MRKFLMWVCLCFIFLPLFVALISLLSPTFGYLLAYVFYIYPVGTVKTYFAGEGKVEISDLTVLVALGLPNLIYSLILGWTIFGIENSLKNKPKR